MPEQIYCRFLHWDKGWYWEAYQQNLRLGTTHALTVPRGPFGDRTEAEQNFSNWIRMQSDLEVEFVE